MVLDEQWQRYAGNQALQLVHWRHCFHKLGKGPFWQIGETSIAKKTRKRDTKPSYECQINEKCMILKKLFEGKPSEISYSYTGRSCPELWPTLHATLRSRSLLLIRNTAVMSGSDLTADASFHCLCNSSIRSFNVRHWNKHTILH